jgi:hypothetical protein
VTDLLEPHWRTKPKTAAQDSRIGADRGLAPCKAGLWRGRRLSWQPFAGKRKNRRELTALDSPAFEFWT